MEENIFQLWERRSLFFKEDIEGVLPKFLPRQINYFLHQWMLNNIELAIDNKTVKVLDLGCSYGRLSKSILEKFPNTKVTGIDISKTYINFYNKGLHPRGKAVVGTITNLPFSSNQFDVVFMVTTLMYLMKKSDQKKASNELCRVLKKGGRFIIIEPNLISNLIIFLGTVVKLYKGNNNLNIPSKSFSTRYIKTLIKQNGCQIDKISTIPIWTLMMSILLLSSKISYKFTEKLLNVISFLDNKKIFPPILSLYIAYIGKK